MAISLDPAEPTLRAREYYRKMALEQMRPISRKYDEQEHTVPSEWVEYFWKHGRAGPGGGSWSGPSDGMVQVCVQAEELCWGDAALYLRLPTAALGGSAVAAAGTAEQKRRFLAPFRSDGPPVWGAMVITEPEAGSDAAAIQTTAVMDGDEWVLNGTKIFCTSGESDFMEMETELQAARLLTWRAARLLTRGKPNNLEASMAKAKAGLAVTVITQKAVELLGPLGYSRKLLVEKWMRDAKINDIYEGTQQINQLIVARRILDYSSSALR